MESELFLLVLFQCDSKAFDWDQSKLYESDAFALLSRDGGLFQWENEKKIKKMLPLILVDLFSVNFTFPDIIFMRRVIGFFKLPKIS